MRKALLSIFILTLIFSTTRVYGQQDPQFSQYMLNYLFNNPAYAGVEGFTKITAVHRSQWSGFNTTFDGSGGAPNTQYIGMTTPVQKLRGGVGFFIVNDNLGPQNNLQMQLSFAYHLAIKESKLSFGLRTGIYSQSIDAGEYRIIREDDPIYVQLLNNDSQVRPDLALGVWFQSEKVFAGVSFNHLLKSEFDFGVAGLRNALEEHLVFTAGYNYELNYNLVVTPTVILKSDLNEISIEGGAIGTYDDKYWAGLSFRQGDAFIAMLGVNLLKDKSLSIGYSFDYVFKGQDAKQPTSHEVLLSYTLPALVTGGKKIIRTPRFRH